jgi:hypothetical protein
MPIVNHKYRNPRGFKRIEKEGREILFLQPAQKITGIDHTTTLGKLKDKMSIQSKVLILLVGLIVLWGFSRYDYSKFKIVEPPAQKVLTLKDIQERRQQQNDNQ